MQKVHPLAHLKPVILKTHQLSSIQGAAEFKKQEGGQTPSPQKKNSNSRILLSVQTL